MADRSVKADPIGPADDTIMTGHRMVRDGSWWRCMHGCGTIHPFPSPYPQPETPCVPRRWGDQ